MMSSATFVASSSASVDSKISADDIDISTHNLHRTSDIGVVGGQEVDETDYDSRYFKATSSSTEMTDDNISNNNPFSFPIHDDNCNEGIITDDDDDDNYHHHDNCSRRTSMTGGSSSRIQFSTKKLYGRERQLSLLHKFYKQRRQNPSNNTTTTTTKIQCVHITGYSGSGKTALIKEFIEQLQNQNQTSNTPSSDESPSPLHIFHGKYEQPTSSSTSNTAVPYKGITDAFKGWYSSLTEQEKEALSSYMQLHFRNMVGDDVHILVDIIPSLKRLVLPETPIGGIDDDGNSNDVHDIHEQNEDGGGSNDTLGKLSSTLSTDSSIKGTKKMPPNNNSNTNAMTDDPVNQSRLHFVFKSFLKCLCQSRKRGANDNVEEDGQQPQDEETSSSSSSSSIIFIFDDVQWADFYSLDLLRSILLDSSSKCNSLVILSTRSNEIEDEDHPVNQRLLHPVQKIRQEGSGGDDDDDDDTILNLEVENLKQPDIGEFIADTLLLSIDEVAPLTAAIFSRTLGNIFFTMQAMEQLLRQNALYYDMVLFQWKWVQLSQQQLEDRLSKDIVEMVRSKIKCLSSDTQRALCVFSHTRSTLDSDTLWELFDATSSSNVASRNNINYDKSGLFKLLNEAVAEGLLTSTTTREESVVEYSFVHDRIREAARSFWVGDLLHENLFLIASALVLRGSDYDVGEDWMLITAVQHLNSIPSRFHNEQGKLSLARLNLETAKLSMGRAAFEDAASYAEKGIQCLPQNRWHDHGVLSHELYALAAESSRLIGHLAQMERYCTTCLTAEKDCPQESKCDILFTLANGFLYGSHRFKEAKEIVLDILKHLGCPFPRSSIRAQVQTISRVLRLVMTKRKRRANYAEKMDFMTDEIVIKKMKFLDLLVDICYLTNDELLTPLILFKALEYTLKYGVSIYSPRLVASLCVIFTGPLNKLQDGNRHANFSLQLMKKVNHKPIESGTLFVLYLFGFHWTTTTRDCVQPLRDAYELGMNTGQVEYACWCISLALTLLFQSGCPLPVLESELTRYILRMEELGQKTISKGTHNILNCVLGLMGASKDSIDLRGSEMAELPVMKAAIENYKRVELAYLGDYEQCANSAVKYGNFLKAVPGGPEMPFAMFLSALSCLEMARQKPDKPEYMRVAKRNRKWIISWAKQGSPNQQHRRALLDAEIAAIQRHDKEALRKFALAVDLSLEGKFPNDAAVSCERWGTFALEVLGDEVEAQRRLTDSLELCTKWGAVGKIRRLKERFPTIFRRQKHV